MTTHRLVQRAAHHTYARSLLCRPRCAGTRSSPNLRRHSCPPDTQSPRRAKNNKMSKLAFDYKWDNIEISDDEADTHPNIDKASWFRMKHRSRVEREETEKMEKTAMEKENKADGEREREIVCLLAEVRSGGDAAEYEDEDALVGELEEVRGGVESNVASRRWWGRRRKRRHGSRGRVGGSRMRSPYAVDAAGRVSTA